MISVENIYISPVKSLSLLETDVVHVGANGIVEDRRLYLIDENGAVLTQRKIGALVRIQARYKADAEELTLVIPGVSPGDPDRKALTGRIRLGDSVVTTMWGRQVKGRIVEGDWSQALTEFCGQPVRLAQSEMPGECYDEYPVSLLSQASLDFLGKQFGDPHTFESKRFRPNFLLGGCEPHQEDDWIGEVIRLGPDLVIQVIARDPRCDITTHNPETGDRDIDTLRLILSYRPNARAPFFGVYGVVVRPGAVSVGDQVVTPFME
ncbi:MAG TPA: MOSC domain-containing protein [Dehalococcoidia bacterium]|nr:MOSC domain-containing protein [Dehalococcoidia bacterium]